MSQRNASSTGTAGRLLLLVLAVLSLLGTMRPAHAQSDNGTVAGTVTDQTGAVVPGAAVTVTNTQTGFKFNATSNNSGEFRIPAVPRGDYQAAIAAAGFQSQEVRFQVEVTTTQTLDVKLAVGSAAQSVDVTGAAPLIDTSGATLGDVIEGKQVTDLPLNGRNFTGLALLTPGVTRGAYGDGASGVNGNAESFRNN